MSMAYLPETSAWVEGIYQIEKSDPVSGGAEINEVTKQGISNLPLLQLASRTAFLKQRVEDLSSIDPIELTVGSVGDFTSFVEACEEISRYRAGFRNNLFSAKVTLLTGFELTEQLIVRGVDLSWVEVHTVDPVVPIIRSTLTTQVDSSYPAFSAIVGGALPTFINALFQMDGSGAATGRHGCYLRRAGAPSVWTSGGGVRNAGGNGLDVSFSSMLVNGCDFSGAGGDGLLCQTNANIAAGGTDLSGAGGNGARVRVASTATLRDANCRKGASDSSSDIVVDSGAIITAFGSIGGTNIAANTLTSNGIIFK